MRYRQPQNPLISGRCRLLPWTRPLPGFRARRLQPAGRRMADGGGAAAGCCAGGAEPVYRPARPAAEALSAARGHDLPPGGAQRPAKAAVCARLARRPRPAAALRAMREPGARPARRHEPHGPARPWRGAGCRGERPCRGACVGRGRFRVRTQARAGGGAAVGTARCWASGGLAVTVAESPSGRGSPVSLNPCRCHPSASSTDDPFRRTPHWPNPITAPHETAGPHQP